jgi:uncharacterized protein YdhG (YjbR/CyaY superfamily)
MTKFSTVEQYFGQLSGPVKVRMEKVRETIRKAAPGAEEVISYNMPAFRLNSVLVYYAAYAKHIGVYPTGSGIEAFQKEIAGYKNSKGAVQFQHDEPLPLGLITRIVKFRVKVTGADRPIRGKSGR